MYRVLVFGMTDNYGGVERVVMNYYNEFDKSKVHFDFLCNTLNKMAYEDELKLKGSKVIHTVPKRKNLIRYFREMKKFFKNNRNNYDCLWFNVNNLVNIDCVKLAKKYNFSKIIIHSHNSRIMEQGFKGYLKERVHITNKNKIKKYATDFWACSHVAADWLFPPSLVSEVQIIKNAINLENTSFNQLKRNRVRKEYGIENCFVIGNVGRLHFQKNQLYMLDLFKEVLKQKPNSKLILVGEGPDKSVIEEKIHRLNLENKVLLVGLQKDMQAWYSAFDLFLFPSVFEGLSVALLEAQANGISIISSDRVSPSEIKVNPNIKFISLNEPREYWKEKIVEFDSNSRLDPEKVRMNFENKGYEIRSAAKKVQEKFLK